MEFISRYWSQIRQHLSGLNASQRIAIGLCAVLVLVGVVWMVQWSGQPERVPLLMQPLSPDEKVQIVNMLRGAGADFEERDTRILVREGERSRLLAQLQQSRALPAKTSISFAKLMEENNPFLARDDAQWRKERALEGELSSVLMHFDGLSDAKVFIQVPQRRRLGGDTGKASASVYVQTRAGFSLDKNSVGSIADFVSGAVEGLTPDAVKIVDSVSHRSYRTAGREESLPFDVLDIRRQREEHYAKKIADQLSFIPGVLVGVHVDINLDRKSVIDTKLGKPQTSEEENKSMTSNRAGGAAGPGVKPNVAKAVTAGGGSDSQSTEESKTSFNGERDRQIVNTETLPGDNRKLTASINIPRSYFAGIWRHLNPQAKDEPKDTDLDPIIKSELTKVRGQVRKLIDAADDTQVEANWFYDGAIAAAAGGSGGISSTGVMAARAGAADTVGLLREFGPQLGLGLLAVFALFTVMRLATRAQRAIERRVDDAQPAARRKREAPVEDDVEQLATDGGPVGEAAVSEAVLEGREVGEDEIRIRHLIAQIGQLVQEDTATAAGLVEHWVGESR